MTEDKLTAAKIDATEDNRALKSFMRNVEALVNIPLVPEGSKIVVDEEALEGIWPTAIARYIPDTIPPEKRAELKGKLIRHFNKASAELPFDASEINNETAEPERTLIMASPENRVGPKWKAEKMQDFKEWACVRHALVQAGAHLETVDTPTVNEWNLDVFTRDRYLLIGNAAYLPDTAALGVAYNAHRQKFVADEIRLMQAAMEARGVKTVTVKSAFFEGGNVIRNFDSKTIFVGIYSPYYTISSAEKLLEAINNTQPEKWAMQPVQLTNFGKMYHMDTGMSEELPNGEVMLSPLLTDAPTFDEIRSRIGPEKVIELTNRDANNLATNMIDVGNTVIMTNTCPEAELQLTDRGYKVVSPVDYGEATFAFGRGGVHCMTNDAPQIRVDARPRKRPGARL